MLSISNVLLLLSVSSSLVSGSPLENSQTVLDHPREAHRSFPHHEIDNSVLAALEAHADPVDALVYLRPHLAAELAEPRLLHIAGEPSPAWMTEGDKMRLRRRNKKFVDITDHREFYARQLGAAYAGNARKTPPA